MKIVFVVPDMAGGGSERVISLLANEFVKRGIDTAILSFAGSQQAYPLDPQVETISAGEASGGSLKVRIKRLRAMRQYFKKNKDCYIFSFSTYGTGFVVLSTLFMKCRMLVSERIDPRSCDHKAYRDFFYRFAYRLVCQTEEAVTCFPKQIRKKACVIGNPLDASVPMPFEGERRKSISTVGRLEEQKNHHLLIEAFSIFSEKFPEYTLDIYGKGILEKQLKEFAKEKGLERKVIFHGFCSNAREEIRDSAMFVLSSDYEGISNSMLEALAMGIPVISTDCPIGGSRTNIKDGINGLLVPMKDAEALADAMERVAGDRGLAEKMSLNARKIRQECTVEKVADQFLKVAERGA